MPKKKPAIVQDQDTIDALNDDFAEVRKLAAQSEKGEQKTEELRCETLDRMFVFGQSLRRDVGRLEAFVTANGLTMNKVTRQNPYNALVRLAFSDKLKKAAISQYARTLDYAHVTRINQPISDWLMEEGIAVRYREAVQHFSDPYRKFRAEAQHKRAELGKSNLDKLSISSPFELNADLEPGTYAKALIRIGSAGKNAQVVTLLDMSDAEQNRIFASHGGSIPAQIAVLQTRPLFHLFRAIDLVTPITALTKDARILIHNEAETGGSARTVVETASANRSFPWARVRLKKIIDELPDRGVLLTAADAGRFLKEFRSDLTWALTPEPKPALQSSAGNSVPLALMTNAPLRIGDGSGRKTRQFSLSARSMEEFISFNKHIDKLLAKGPASTARRPPTRIELRSNGMGYDAVPVKPSSFTMALLVSRSKAALAHNRWLPATDLASLCQLLEPYSVSVTGAFRDSDVKDAAISVEYQFDGDEFEACIPMVTSHRMDRTLVCENLPIPQPPSPPSPALQKSKKKALAAAASERTP